MKTIGIKLADGSFYPVLEEGKPTEKTLDLTTAHNNQTKIMVDLYRSANCTMEDAEYVDSLQIDNLIEHPNGEPDISFQVSIDENNELSAKIIDTETGNQSDTTITLVSRTIQERLVTDEYNISDTIEAEALGTENSEEAPDNSTQDSKAALAAAGVIAGAGLLAAANAIRDAEKNQDEETAEISEDDFTLGDPEADTNDVLDVNENPDLSETPANDIYESPSSELDDFDVSSITEEQPVETEETAVSDEEVSGDFLNLDNFDLKDIDNGDVSEKVPTTEDNSADTEEADFSSGNDMFISPSVETPAEPSFEDPAEPVSEETPAFGDDSDNLADDQFNFSDNSEPEVFVEDENPESNTDLSDFDLSDLPDIDNSTAEIPSETTSEIPAENSDDLDLSDSSSDETIEASSFDDLLSNDNDMPNPFEDDMFVEISEPTETEADDSFNDFASDTTESSADLDFTSSDSEDTENIDLDLDLGSDDAFNLDTDNSDFDLDSSSQLPDFDETSFDDSSESSDTVIMEDPVAPEDDYSLPDFDDIPDINNASTSNLDEPDTSLDLDDDLFSDTSNDMPAAGSGISFTGLYDTETELGKSADYEDDDVKKKTKVPVIICIVCAVICVIATLLVLFIIPSKYNLLSKKAPKETVPVETTVEDKTEELEETPVQQKEEIEEIEETIPEEEPVPEAAEDEVIVIEKAEEVVPLPPPVVEEVKPKNITYKIRWGDTLWDIADTYYKNPWRYKYIARYNGIKDPDYIISGNYIIIPAE